MAVISYFRVGRPWVVAGILIDGNGVFLLAASVAFVAILLLYFRLRKWLAGRGRMEEVAGGALRLAAARGRVADMELLTSLPGFQIDADVCGWTALMAAAVQGQPAACVWLLNHGADIRKQKEDGWRDTVLHYAAGRGCKETVQVLLAFGADATAKNALGATPGDVATKAGHKALARLLQAVVEGTEEQPQREAIITKYKAAANNAVTQPAGAPVAQATIHASSFGIPEESQLHIPEPTTPRSPTAAVSRTPAKNAEAATDAAGRPRAARKLAQRGFEGWGRPGTQPRPEMRLFRPLAILTEVLGGIYLMWRALRTLQPGWGYFYSIPWWLAEFAAYCLSYSFVMGLFYMVERPTRRLSDMLSEKALPHVDIFVVTYSEPPEVVEPTATAALNVNWPTSRFTVHVLDDGKRPEMAKLVRRLRFQCRHMKRDENIIYVARDKKKGVPHHAKAGNINSCLLKEGPGKGDFILVLDCDMIVHPDILERTLGHFYREREPGEDGSEKWVPKERAAFIQTPQDFYNVDASDPMVHCARFFYGPMLQGRDGIGACPCCGTGVVFRRDILVSMGGQSYGSITEDYNTAMALLSAGHATMFLNERLSYGLAPEDIVDVFGQRLRWSMGALQIMMNSNPLRLPGLSWSQSFLFFEAAAHNYLAIPTVMMLFVPVIYLFTEYSPMICESLWEFAAIFGSWYTCNRLMMWLLHYRTEGGLQELWRGSQMWVWGAPNQLKAIWKVLVAENAIVKRLFNFEITFVVTKKDKNPEEDLGWESLKAALWVTWPHLLYVAAFTAASIYFLVRAVSGAYSAAQIMLCVAAFCWGTLALLCIWPPIATLLPRVETESGWKVAWHPTEPAVLEATPEQSSTGLLRGLSRSMSLWLHPRPAAMQQMPCLPEATAEQGIPGLPSMRRPPLRPNGFAGSARPSLDFPPGHRAAGSARPSLDIPPGHPLAAMVRPNLEAGMSGFTDSARPSLDSRGSPAAYYASSFFSTTQPINAAAARTAKTAMPPVTEEVGSGTGSAPARAPSIDHRQQRSSFQVPVRRFGRISMDQRRQLALQQSALLTSVVLPERSQSSLSSAVSVMLDAAGNPSPLLSLDQRANSVYLGPAAPGTVGPQYSAGSSAQQVEALNQIAMLTGVEAAPGTQGSGSVSVDVGSLKHFLGDAGSSTAAAVSPFSAASQIPAAAETQGTAAAPRDGRALSGASSNDVTPSNPGSLWVGPPGSSTQSLRLEPNNLETAFASPFAALALDASFSFTDDEEDALANELADEAATELAAANATATGANGSPASSSCASSSSSRVSYQGPNPQTAKVAATLMEIAASLSPENAMMLERGDSMVVPVMPASVWEHSLMAKPDFSAREAPTGSKVFLVINLAILLSLVAGAILDFQFTE